MNALELEITKNRLAQEILNIDDENLLNKVINLINGNAKAEEFERIPGLPYTPEERAASLRRAQEQYHAGLYITTEELEKEMEEW